MKRQARCPQCGLAWRAQPCGSLHLQQRSADRHRKVQKAVFNLATQALIWHAVRVFQTGRYPKDTNEKNLRKAALQFLKLDPAPHEMKG